MGDRRGEGEEEGKVKDGIVMGCGCGWFAYE